MTTTKIAQWLAHRLPAKLKYFVTIDVVAYATTGKYGKTVVYKLSAMDAIDRFGKDKNLS